MSQRNKAIPVDPREYPPYEYHEYPKLLGKDEAGVSIVAESAAHEASLREEHPDLPPWQHPGVVAGGPSYSELQRRLADLEAENALLKGEPSDSDLKEDPFLNDDAAQAAGEVEEPSSGNGKKKKK